MTLGIAIAKSCEREISKNPKLLHIPLFHAMFHAVVLEAFRAERQEAI